MLDIGWSELLLIGIVALIVIGPKDLPAMFRNLGRITAKARQMAREFSNAMEDAAKESGIKETTDDLKTLASKKSLGLDALERATQRFESWDPKFPQRDQEPALKADPDLPAQLDAAELADEPEPVSPAAKPSSESPKADAPKPDATKKDEA